jgi:hypothetical protein
MNKSIQGPQINTLTRNDKVNPFMKKLEMWKRNTEYSTSYMFPASKDVPAMEQS